MNTLAVIGIVIVVVGIIKYSLDKFYGIRFCLLGHQYAVQVIMRHPGKRSMHSVCEYCNKHKVVESVDPYDHH